MSEPTQENPLEGFSDGQIKVLQEVYSLTDEYEITDEEMKIAREMFPTAKHFQVLRKILGIYTQPERGLTMKNAQSLVQADPSEQSQYIMETAVNSLADTKLQSALLGFHRRIKSDVQQEKIADFQAANKEEKEEAERTESHEAAEAEKLRVLPVNV